MLSQSVEDKLYSFTVTVKVLGKDNNIIKIDQLNVKGQIAEHHPHQVLEHGSYLEVNRHQVQGRKQLSST
ncbi:hypothetical protein MHYP_G00044310 [Metynnis hypsauchen]